MHPIHDANQNASPAQTAAPPNWPQVVLTLGMMLGLTGMSFVFTSYLVSIGAIDVVTGAWVAVSMVVVINGVVFKKRVTRGVRSLRKATAALLKLAVALLETAVTLVEPEEQP
ncbi:hypothetical protein [Nocardia asiatica]|uniref:hypothetical protein n=1 Tax=Nocardia asiatica TaxID=209252 RepID=UPI003EDEE181